MRFFYAKIAAIFVVSSACDARMNVLVLSNSMGRNVFHSGISDFVWTQTQLMAENNPDVSFVYVSTGDFSISFSQPLAALKTIY